MVLFAVGDEEEGKKFINRYGVTENFSKKHLLLSNSFTMENLFFCGKSKSFNVTLYFYESAFSLFIHFHLSNKLKKDHNKKVSSQNKNSLT